MGAFQADPPERLPQKFVALPPMKFVQEILEITRRRLLVAFQPKKLRNIVIVKLVHAAER
jgi:hypothetical protein